MAAKGHLLDFTKQPKQENQDTLFNHVSKIVRTVSDPKNSLGANSSVEVLSNHIKNTQFKYRQPSMDTDVTTVLFSLSTRKSNKQRTMSTWKRLRRSSIKHRLSTQLTASCPISITTIRHSRQPASASAEITTMPWLRH